MARLTIKHSKGWIEKLLAIQEVSSSERQTLLQHIASCGTCQYILNEYYELTKQLERLELQHDPDLPKALPPRLLEMWLEEDCTSKTSEQEYERRNYVDEVVLRLKRSL